MAGKLPGRALDSNTSISVSNISFGSNLSINTSAISIGNSTVNTVLKSNSATFSGHLMPTANITYDLGNSSMRWRDLWLSGTTINLGGAVIQTDTDSGAVAIIPKPTNDTPNPMAVILSPMGGVAAAQSVNGVVGAPAIAAAARSNNAMAVPIDIATSTPSNGQMLVWSTSSNTFIPHSTVAALTVTGTSTLKAISSNGSVGSAGQLLASNGTSTYWTNPPASTNTDAQYTWANTHTFNAPITIANTLTVGNNVTITGNLIVTGSRVFANTTTVDLGDNIIVLNADIGSAAPSENAGFEIHRGSSSNVSLLWNETTDKWTLTTDGSTFLNIATNNDVSTAYSNAIAYSGNAAAAYTNATSFASNADNLSSGTVAFARLPAVYVGTTQIQSTSAAQALSGITTLAAGNTNITGFINVSTNTATFGTALYVVANGNVGIGNTAPADPFVIQNRSLAVQPTVHLLGTNSTFSTNIWMTNYGSDGGIVFRRIAGTAASPTATTSGRITFLISSSTEDGTTFRNTAAVNLGLTATANSTSHPSYIAFDTTDVGAVSRVERVRIDPSGNVGIGNTAPTNKLSVNGTSHFGDVMYFGSGGYFSWTSGYSDGTTQTINFNSVALATNSSSYGVRQFWASNGNVGIGGTTTPASRLHVYGATGQLLRIESSAANGGGFGWIGFYDAGGRKAYIGSGGNDNSFYLNIDGSGGNFYFNAGAATRQVIAANGNVGIGNIAPTQKLYVEGNVYVSGTLTEASSITLKENIDPITGALSLILGINGYTYDRKDGSRKQEPGLIAEEVEQVLPNIVQKDDEGNPTGIQYTKIIAYLVESIKELKAEIDILKGK